MLDFLPCRSVLLAVLMASVASAKERVPQIRNVTFPHRPDQVARPVYMAGEIATVLHFEQNVDPARTKEDGGLGGPLRASGDGRDGKRSLKLALPIFHAACRQFIREEASPSTAFRISAISALKLMALCIVRFLLG